MGCIWIYIDILRSLRFISLLCNCKVIFPIFCKAPRILHMLVLLSLQYIWDSVLSIFLRSNRQPDTFLNRLRIVVSYDGTNPPKCILYPKYRLNVLCLHEDNVTPFSIEVEGKKKSFLTNAFTWMHFFLVLL